MNFDLDRNKETLNVELNEENENLNSENAALVESVTSVLYQAYTAKKELSKERERADEIEKELIGEKKENRRLLESNISLCGDLKEERKRIKNQESTITTLKSKIRILTILIVVMSLLLALACFISTVFMRQEHGSRSILQTLREASHSTPEVADVIPDSVRYTYEDVFHEQW